MGRDGTSPAPAGPAKRGAKRRPAKRAKARRGKVRASAPMHAARDTVGLVAPLARASRSAPAARRATKGAGDALAALPRVSRRAVAALFLERQWLDRPRGRRLGAGTLESFVSATGGLQIDSVNVVDRAHHLTLWSRFGPYDRAKLERLIYRRRVVFEYLSHVACFVAARDLAVFRRYMVELPERWKKRGWMTREFVATVKHVEQAFAERGVLGNADFERPGGEKAGGWWSWKPATHALDYLWKAGKIAVHSRTHFHKRYAPMEHVLPHAAGVDAMPREQVERWRLLRSLEAMGAASEADLGMYLTWPRTPAPERRQRLQALVAEGLVTRVAVEGERAAWFVRTQDLGALARAGRRRQASRGTTLLCPFDSFLWHRERIEKLFGFAYTIEIYVPGHKRTHGYYSLPVIHDGHLIGRVDPKTHREAGVLEIKHAHFEPWFASGAVPPAARWGALERGAAITGVAESIASLAKHVACTRVKLGRVTPAALKPALARALAAVRG